MTPPRLSLCLLVKNAESLLRDCLESVRPLVDEWVIGDTGSQDGTLRLLAELLPDVRIHHLPWHSDFALARNQLLELASGDWVLMLDADERVAPESLASLRQWVAQPPPEPVGIRGVFLDLQQGRLVRRWHKICLLSRHPGLYYQGKVHEQPLLQGAELPIWTEPTLVIQHVLPAPEVWQAKQAQYAALLAAEGESETPLQRYHLAHHRLVSGHSSPEATLQAVEALCEETLRDRDLPPSPSWLGVPLGEAVTNLLGLSLEIAAPEATLARGERWLAHAQEAEALQIVARVSEQVQQFDAAERYWFESLNPALHQRYAESAWEPLLGLGRLAERQGVPLLAAAWRWQAVAQGGLGHVGSRSEIQAAQLAPLERVVLPLLQAQQQAAAERQHDMVLVWSALLLPLHPQVQVFRLAVTAALRLGALGLGAVLGRLGALLWPQDRLLVNSALQAWDEITAVRPADWRLLALCSSQPTTAVRQASGPDWLQALQAPRSGAPGWRVDADPALNLPEAERLALVELLSYPPFYPGPLLLETSAGNVQLLPATLARSGPPLKVQWRS